MDTTMTTHTHMPTLLVQLSHPYARAPCRATDGSVGYDLFSCVDAQIAPGERALVDTGVAIAFVGFDGGAAAYGRIAPRSGLAVRGIDVAAGVCDPDYRGSYRVLLVNNSKQPFVVRPGDRVAQLVCEIVALPDVVVADALDFTERGAGGFGSTGNS